jgi:KRAB domain-containing zinc finger protein
MSKERFEYFKNKEGDYVCKFCDKTTAKQSTMHMHYKAKHSGELPFVCDICDRRFSQKQILDLHTRARHVDNDQVEKYQCPCCDFESQSFANRIIHFTRKHCRDYLDDMKDGTGNEITCTECQKTFKSSTAFYYHAGKCLDSIQGITIPHLDEVLTVG